MSELGYFRGDILVEGCKMQQKCLEVVGRKRKEEKKEKENKREKGKKELEEKEEII